MVLVPIPGRRCSLTRGVEPMLDSIVGNFI
jgi:hypothetical protein